MSVQAEQRRLRQVIELLTSILKENGFLEMRAETFRQAKFDKPEAVEPLWNLLFQTAYLIHNGKVGDDCYELLLELASKKGDVVFSVKKAMLQFGYVSNEFLTLPDDMSAGSRQLLLAFGWLLCKQEVISRLMFASTKDLLIDRDDDARFLMRNGDSGDARQAASDKVDFDRLGLCEKVSRLVWLNGKLQYRLRKLLTLERQLGRMKQRVAVATKGVRGRGEYFNGGQSQTDSSADESRPRVLQNTQKQLLDYLAVEFDRRHLSVLELELLKRPGELERHVAALENDRERLENLLRWRKDEDVFWDWLVSALELDADAAVAAATARRRDENSNESDSTSITTVSSQAQLSSRESVADSAQTEREQDWQLDQADIRELVAAHRRLERACSQYETVASHIDSEWQRRVAFLRNGSGDDEALAPLRRTLDAMLRQIDAQIDTELRVLSRFGWLLAPPISSEADTESTRRSGDGPSALERSMLGELECSTRYYMVEDGAKKGRPAKAPAAGSNAVASLNSRSFATVSNVQSEIARLEADLTTLDDALQSRYRTFSGELRSLAGSFTQPLESTDSLASDHCDSAKIKLLFPKLRRPNVDV